MVPEETEIVENAQLIYAKWSLLYIKFIIISITFKVCLCMEERDYARKIQQKPVTLLLPNIK